MCTRRIFSRPATSGFGTTIWRSKPPGPQQRRIQYIRPVGRRHQDDAFVGFEAVHLDEELVQRLLALVVTAPEPGAAMTANGVDFVDENDTRCVLLRLLEHIAHTACTDPDEHLDKIRTRDREERHIRLTRDCACEKRFAGARRADEQGAAWNTATQPLEFLGIAQKLDDFLQDRCLASSTPATSSNVTRP